MLRISRFSVNGTFRIDSPVSKIEVTTLCVGDVGWDILRRFCSALTGSAGDIESRSFAKRAHMIIAGTIISTIVLTRSEVSESASRLIDQARQDVLASLVGAYRHPN
jgi:hypothetical protein